MAAKPHILSADGKIIVEANDTHYGIVGIFLQWYKYVIGCGLRRVLVELL